jgi:hypothetical protein
MNAVFSAVRKVTFKDRKRRRAPTTPRYVRSVIVQIRSNVNLVCIVRALFALALEIKSEFDVSLHLDSFLILYRGLIAPLP